MLWPASALFKGDSATAARMQEQAKTSPEGELRVLGQQAAQAAALGKVGQMRELRTQAVEKAKGLGMADSAANQLMQEAATEAEFGYPSRAGERLTQRSHCHATRHSCRGCGRCSRCRDRSRRPKR